MAGGKILSGRTKDQNIGYVAEYLTAVGIDLKEVRVVDRDGRPGHAVLQKPERSGNCGPCAIPATGLAAETHCGVRPVRRPIGGAGSAP